ncbi:MAG: hypothetical protein JWP97_2013 [Labilithrix sp.]|nr:hypothetical protein [Labilithrix sp.]
MVDDDEDIRESFSDVLQEEGFAVASCENGLAALHYLASNALPCIIVLDLMMPIMSGAEFREKQLAEPRLKDVPVIVMSAADRGGQIASELGAGGFVAKPARVDQLLTAIGRFC